MRPSAYSVQASRFFTALLTALLIALPALSTHAAVTVEKRPNDNREYRYLELENKLGVLLVSDPETDKAAASLDVHVGSASDPVGREGLAHFLEHMLFLGTEKYPNPDEYKNFIQQRGGGNNAYTAADHTNYFFNIDKAHLEGALDRFAQFFVAPKLDAEYVTREREVVHSEYTSKQRSDGRRAYFAIKQSMNPAHPGARFQVGSRDTLADRDGAAVRDDLLKFYRERYSANIMKLSVVGAESLDELEAMVRPRFAGIPNHNAKPQRTDEPRYLPADLPQRLDVLPLTERRSVSLTFPIPPVQDQYATKPTALLADELGHEGTGSLFATLKGLGLAETLSAGVGNSDRDGASISVSISLTEAGYEQLDTVISLFFDAVALLRDNGIEAWRYEEQATLGQIAFLNADKEEAPRYATRLAASLHDYAPEDILRGPYMMEDFDADATRAILALVTPNNLFMTVIGPGVATDRVGKQFGVEYGISSIDEATRTAWLNPSAASVDLALSEPNPFIPKSLDVADASGASAKPARAMVRPGFTLWHQQDTSFKVARNHLYVSVRSPATVKSARNAMLTRLFTAAVNDELNAFLYPAQQAGQGLSLYAHMRGFSMRFEGFDDGQPLLVDSVLERLKAPAFDAARFAIVKASIERSLRNAAERPPNRRAMNRLGELLIESDWTTQARLDALKPLTVEDLRDFHGELMAEVQVVALSHGNTSRERAQTLGKSVHATLVASAKPVNVGSANVIELPAGSPSVSLLETTHADAAVLIYLQGNSRRLEERAQFALLSQVVSPEFFDDLRTQKNLGYVVFATAYPLLQVPGFGMVVQSPNTGAEALIAEMNGWLAGVPERLRTTDADTLERTRTGLLSQLNQRDTSLSDRTARYWREIDRNEYAFDSRERIAAAIAAVTQEQLVSLAEEALVAKPRSLTIATPGAGKTLDPATIGGDAAVITDVDAFKSELPRVPRLGS